jgi:Xaa-Pro aminopeptidase
VTASSIPAARFEGRLRAAREALAETRADALLVGVGPDLRWLTGYAAMPLERLTMLVVPANDDVRLIVPRLEQAPAALSPAVASGAVTIVTWEETEDPFDRVAEALPGLHDDARLLVSDRLYAAFLLRAQQRLPQARFAAASEVLGPLRAVKDADEIALLRAAAHAADSVVEAIARGRLVGRTEAEVAREVRDRLVDAGHELAMFSIVASGPNSASPHHEASSRVIGPGESIVLDIGGTLEGYGSDTTRTIWVTGGDAANGPTDEFAHLYATLQAAQSEATAAVRPGVPCESIDAVARKGITDAGLGDFFIHRTGHGIGLEGHEDPYLVTGNRDPLPEGAAFSVEPGIYLEGRYGARIEDIVVCGADGPDLLNEAPRDLYVVSGT